MGVLKIYWRVYGMPKLATKKSENLPDQDFTKISLAQKFVLKFERLV